ncbi:MAG TPA: acyltransferase family protein, partial [Pirellulales bacterium]|nr:acyltransferase family protein [Pirellulales bacterium]
MISLMLSGAAPPAKTQARRGEPAQIATAIQALRLWVTLLVVAFHAAIAYATAPLVTTIWLVYDGSCSRAFDLALAWGNGFMMPLFMLLAGVSAARGCEAKSVGDFLKHRARRLLRP